jgi:hypothetical protein
MSLSSVQVKKLLETDKPLKLKQLSLSLLYTRLKHMYKKDPMTKTVSACMSQLNDLFSKFGASAADDFNLLASL